MRPKRKIKGGYFRQARAKRDRFHVNGPCIIELASGRAGVRIHADPSVDIAHQKIGKDLTPGDESRNNAP